MRLTERAHQILEAQIRSGDTVIDATAGQGFDTLKLAQAVGPEGKVYAIDLQAAAIALTQKRLEAEHCLRQCELILGNHATALIELSQKLSGQVSAIVFNLGYLPGSDKSITTLPQSTNEALSAAETLLKISGLFCVTAYRGHSGGLEEAKTVSEWMKSRNLKEWEVQSHEPDVSTNRIPPILWVAKKIA